MSSDYVERDVLDVEAHFDWNRLADASRDAVAVRESQADRSAPCRPASRADGSAAIVAYCESPPPDTVAPDHDERLEQGSTKARGCARSKQRGVFVPVWPLQARRTARLDRRAHGQPSASRRRPMRSHGSPIASKAICSPRRRRSTSSPCCDDRSCRSTSPTLEALVADDARYDVFRLADAAIGGDAGRALRIVAGLRAEGEDLIPLLGWILSQLRMLLRLSGAGRISPMHCATSASGRAREGLYRRALQAALTRRTGSAASRRPRASIASRKASSSTPAASRGATAGASSNGSLPRSPSRALRRIDR